MLFSTTSDFASHGLGDELLQLFRQRGYLKDCPPQTGLLRQDEPIDRVYLIESGLVKLMRTNAQGREVVTELCFPGTMLGAVSALSGNPAEASAATLFFSRIHCLPARVFLEQIKTNLAFSNQVACALGQNQYEQTLHIGRLGVLSTRGRVASLLLRFIQAADQNQHGEIHLQMPINQTDAARLLAMSRENYSRMLKKLEEAGLIRRNKEWIYISDLELLRREAGE